MGASRKVSLLDILGILVLFSMGAAIVLPLLTRARTIDHRSNCSNNLSQLGKAMIMYEDVPGNGDVYPTVSATKNPMDPSADAQEALTLLYGNYINDVRVFSCSRKPLAQDLLQSVLKTSDAGWRERSFKQSKPGIAGRSSSYGYSPGHKQDDGQCIVAADRQGTGPNGNSDNHGPDAGQNCLAAGGNVEFRDSKINRSGNGSDRVSDDDIYADKTVTPSTFTEFESFLR